MSDTAEFFTAVGSGDLARVRQLLAAVPALVNARDDEGATPLHYAALNGRQEVVQFLVNEGADVNARDGRFGATPTGWAIEYLRGLGGFLSMEIEDMIAAIRQGDVEWVRRFLTRLPRLAACRDRNGKALLDHAEESRNAEIARLFRAAEQTERTE